MKRKASFLLFCVAGMTVLLILCSCGNNSSENDSGNDNQIELESIYEDDISINRFLNNYNTANQGAPINSDMIQKDEHHGQVHDDQVNVLGEEHFEVNLNSSYPFQVFIKGYDLKRTEEEYKDLFMRYAKGFDSTLTDETLNAYWEELLDHSNSEMEFDEFSCRLNIFSNRIEYITINGTVK